jgi:hypothetical protein
MHIKDLWGTSVPIGKKPALVGPQRKQLTSPKGARGRLPVNDEVP